METDRLSCKNTPSLSFLRDVPLAGFFPIPAPLPFHSNSCHSRADKHDLRGSKIVDQAAFKKTLNLRPSFPDLAFCKVNKNASDSVAATAANRTQFTGHNGSGLAKMLLRAKRERETKEMKQTQNLVVVVSQKKQSISTLDVFVFVAADNFLFGEKTVKVLADFFLQF